MNPNIIFKEVFDLFLNEPFNSIFWAGFWAIIAVQTLKLLCEIMGVDINV